jgi:hypothetical protein
MLVLPGVQAAVDDEAAISLIKQEIERAKVLMNASMNRDMTQQKLAKELDSYNKDISYMAYL